jgi:hypothetical protein
MRTFTCLLVMFGLAAGMSSALADDLPTKTAAKPICGVVRAVRTAGGATLYFADVPFIMVTHHLEKGGEELTQYELDEKNRLGIFDAKGGFTVLAGGIAVAVGDEVWARFSAEISCTLYVRADGLEAEGVFSPPDVTPQQSRATIPYEG